MWGRGHCTTAHFFLQGEAAMCKASPFTTKPARVGKPSPRRSPWQTPSSQREGGYSFLYSPLFVFFMCAVLHTFPAYNDNEMPRDSQTAMLARLFMASENSFLCAGFRAISPDFSPKSPRRGKYPGNVFFMVSVSQRKLFFCARFCAVARAWKGPFPVVVFHHGTGKKSGFPSLCQPLAHVCKLMQKPDNLCPKISGFLRVVATTQVFFAGRT